jgi:hypothetical protein
MEDSIMKLYKQSDKSTPGSKTVQQPSLLTRLICALNSKSFLCLGLLLSSSYANGASCDSLAAGPIATPPGAGSAEITALTAETLDPNQPFFVAPYAVPHCLVKAAIVTQNASNPFDTSTINIYLRLPNVWNEKLFMGGDGGFAGHVENKGFLGFPIYLN